MSRARTLAGAIGSDGALNVADVAGLAAVASSGSASDLSTGTLSAARIADGSLSDLKISGLSASKLTGNRVWTPIISVSGSTNYNIASNTWFQFSGYNFNGLTNFFLKATFYNQDGGAGYTGEHVGGPFSFDTGVAANTFGIASNTVQLNGHGHTATPPTCSVRFNNTSTATVRLEIMYSYINSLHIANGTVISILNY